MARHIHIYLPARVRDTAPAPAKHPPAAVSELVERLMQAIADRSGKKTTDAGFDESKVKRDEGGKFSAQQHTAAAAEHQAKAASHTEALKNKKDMSMEENQVHHAAVVAHGKAAEHHTLAASTGKTLHASMAHNQTKTANEYSARVAPQQSTAQTSTASSKPTKSTAKGKAGAHELLSSGHPFSVDELMAATGVTNRTTMLTALSDLKNPKYAGSKGALNIVKRADGSYHVQKADAGAVAQKPMSSPSGNLPDRVGPDGKDVGSAQNTQARIEAKTLGQRKEEKEAAALANLKAKGMHTDPRAVGLVANAAAREARAEHRAAAKVKPQGSGTPPAFSHSAAKAELAAKGVSTNTAAGHNLLSSFLKNENAKTSKGIPDGRTTLPTGHIAHMTTYPNGAKHVTLKHPDTTYLHRIQYGPDGKVRGHQIDTPTKIQTVRGPATGTKTKTLTPEESESMHNKLHRVIRDVPDKK